MYCCGTPSCPDPPFLAVETRHVAPHRAGPLISPSKARALPAYLAANLACTASLTCTLRSGSGRQHTAQPNLCAPSPTPMQQARPALLQRMQGASSVRALVLVAIAAAFCAAFTPHGTKPRVPVTAEANQPKACPPQWLPITRTLIP